MVCRVILSLNGGHWDPLDVGRVRRSRNGLYPFATLRDGAAQRLRLSVTIPRACAPHTPPTFRLRAAANLGYSLRSNAETMQQRSVSTTAESAPRGVRPPFALRSALLHYGRNVAKRLISISFYDRLFIALYAWYSRINAVARFMIAGCKGLFILRVGAPHLRRQAAASVPHGERPSMQRASAQHTRQTIHNIQAIQNIKDIKDIQKRGKYTSYTRYTNYTKYTCYIIFNML